MGGLNNDGVLGGGVGEHGADLAVEGLVHGEKDPVALGALGDCFGSGDHNFSLTRGQGVAEEGGHLLFLFLVTYWNWV